MRALAAGLALTEAAHTPALSVLVAGRVTRGQALAVLQVGARSGPIREALVVREMELPVGIPGLIRVHLVLVPRTVVMAAVALIVAVQIVSIRVALAVREKVLPVEIPGLIRVHLALVPQTVGMAAVDQIVEVQVVSIRVALAMVGARLEVQSMVEVQIVSIRVALVVREMVLPVGILGLIRVHLALVPRTVGMAAVDQIVEVQIVSIRVALAVREMELPAGMPKVAHTVVHEVVTIHRRHVHHGRQINPDLVQPRLDGMPKEDFLRPELRVLPFLKMRRWKNWIDRRKTSCAHWMKFNARMLLVTL